jgi:hypothetical protein
MSHSIAHRSGMNGVGAGKWPDGMVPWEPERAPDLKAPYPESRYCTTGRLRSCGYCGSMHPADVAAAIRAGARGHWADFKYGWPHKAYFDGIANPHAGMLESRMGCSHAVPDCPATGKPCDMGEQSAFRPSCGCMARGEVATGTRNGQPMVLVQDGFDQVTGKPTHTWRDPGKPAGEKTDGKFYTEHLQDASPEDRETIERHLGLAFTFDGERVSWKPIQS